MIIYLKKIFYFILFFIGVTFFQTCKKNNIKAEKVEKLNQEQSNTVKKEIDVTIFVHGTHSLTLTNILKNVLKLPNELTKISEIKSLWYAPVLKYMSKNNPEYFPNEHFYIYGWSGALCEKAREQAGQKLFLSIKKLIKEYSEKNLIPKITIITHSHGGNVALNLAHPENFKESNCDEFSIEKLILLACPVQELTKTFIKNKIFKKIYNIYSSMDMLQCIDPQGIYKINKEKKDCPLFSKRRFEPQNNLKQAKIKINDRSILHVEFICKKFLKTLPQITTIMDKIESDNNEYLLKLYTYKNDYKIVNINNYKYRKKNRSVIPENLSNNVTIFVHGTHTLSKLVLTYTNQNNKLIKAKDLNKKYCSFLLADSLAKTNSKEFPFDEFYAFGWSGKLSSDARKEASQNLYLEIQNLIHKSNLQKRNPKITIITHSHGGNVALNLANFKNEKGINLKIDRLILLACPIQEETKSYVNHQMFNKIYNIYSSMDMLQILDPQAFHKVNKNNKDCPILSKRVFNFDIENLKQSKIKINNRSLMHVEFITERFFKLLPSIINEMDQLNSESNHLIKINTHNNLIETVR